jgi:uncharacterized protein
MLTIHDARIAYEDENFEYTLEILMPLVKSDDIEAHMLLAAMYSMGQGVQKSFSEAAKWYRLPAEAGNLVAQNNLAMMLFTSNEINNLEEGIRWLIIAAEKGACMSQSVLGDIYSGAYNLPEPVQKKYLDISKAVELYRSAGSGFSYAYHRLGEIYEKGLGIEKNVLLAAQYYQQAIDMGYEP